MRSPQLLITVAALVLAGCPAVSSEPPPPPRKPEIPTAPPRARGALAGGTDAAPRPDVTLPEEEVVVPDVRDDPDAPPVAPKPAPHGSAPVPKTLPPHPAPDAGMAL